MKKKILNIVLAAAVTPFLCCCTDNFEEYNTNPYEPHSLNPPMLFATMITTGINVQQNDNQMIDQMVAGPFSGYLTMANSWGGSNFNTFNQTESWNQSTCLGSKLKYGQRGSIIDIKRCIQQILQFIIELLPFISCQLSALDFFTRNFTNVRDQTIDQLNVTHFKRKQGYRIPEIHGNILSH